MQNHSKIHFSFVKANGITHRIASTHSNLLKKTYQTQKYPLILFLHGFPESWYSWRHQLLHLRHEPFLAVAPDMRGYGSTTQPFSMEEYTQPVLARDVVEIAKAIGYDRFVVVGHDWGAALAWSVTLLYPRHVLGVCGMSVPYAGTSKSAGLLTTLQARYGPCLDTTLPRHVRLGAKFHYVLHHCLPRCADEYDRNSREFLYRMYAARPDCDRESGTPEHDVRGLMFPPTGHEERDTHRTLDATAAPGLWKRMPRPTSLPKWLTQEDLEYYIQEFERSGFHGGLCWYRALDRNVELMKQALSGSDDRIRPPSLFLTGEDDSVIDLHGGKQNVVDKLKLNLPGLTREPIFMKGCGHWIQQEEPGAVNDALMKFFHGIRNAQARRNSKL